MRPSAGEVLHFSEDPAIEVFEPHVARTARQPEPYVWAVDAEQAPAYWFPRDCPRAMAWRASGTSDADAALLLGPAADRVHVIEHAWLRRFLDVRLYAYRLPAGAFRPFGDPAAPSAMVATERVAPLGPAERVPDLLQLHAGSGIELRVGSSLGPFVEAVLRSSLRFSVVRWPTSRIRG